MRDQIHTKVADSAFVWPSFVIAALSLGASVAVGQISCPFPGYEPPATLPTSPGAWKIVSGDFNNDGAIDLAVLNFSSNSTIGVRLGVGDGTFGAQTIYSFAVSSLQGFDTGDIDGDGALDLVIGTASPSRLVIMRGLGDGAFAPAGEFDTGGVPRNLELGDLNGDGLLDVAVVNQLAQGAVLINDGAGGFGPPIPFATGNAPENLALGDFDNDGDLDVAVVNLFSEDATILLNPGDGALEEFFTFDLHNGPRAIKVGDFNEDGFLDLAVLPDSTKVAIARGFGQGAFFLLPSTPVNSSVDIAVADLDMDGRLDVAAGVIFFTNSTPMLDALLGDGAGLLAPSIEFSTDVSLYAITVADFNSDGRPDIAGVGESTLTILIARPPSLSCAADLNGDGRIGGADLAILLVNWGPANEGHTAADLNNDGVVNGPDLATLLVNWTTPTSVAPAAPVAPAASATPAATVSSAPPASPASLASPAKDSHRDDAIEQPPTDLVWAPPDGGVVREQIARDLNHDGWLDRTVLLASGANATRDASPEILVYLSNADGSLRLVNTIGSSFFIDPVDMDLCDVNGDGDLDLLLADPANGALVVMLGMPQFGFNEVATIAFAVEPTAHSVRQCVESLVQSTTPTPVWLERLRRQLAKK